MTECRICRYQIPRGDLCERCRHDIRMGIIAMHPEDILTAREMANRARRMKLATDGQSLDPDSVASR